MGGEKGKARIYKKPLNTFTCCYTGCSPGVAATTGTYTICSFERYRSRATDFRFRTGPNDFTVVKYTTNADLAYLEVLHTNRNKIQYDHVMRESGLERQVRIIWQCLDIGTLKYFRLDKISTLSIISGTQKTRVKTFSLFFSAKLEKSMFIFNQTAVPFFNLSTVLFPALILIPLMISKLHSIHNLLFFHFEHFVFDFLIYLLETSTLCVLYSDVHDWWAKHNLVTFFVN